MISKLVLVLFVVLMSPILAGVARFDSPPSVSNRYILLPVKMDSRPACRAKGDLSDALRRLSSERQSESDQARKTLLDYSRETRTCREEIIGALIDAMDKPNLNFELDRESYLLWREGSPLLGDMKATKAIDLLISHLDLNDGEFSGSMVHQPAVLGIIRMGPIAIPKLSVALQQNPNRDIRLAAALCLINIGGQAAIRTLRQAFPSESDPCVTRFIQLSIDIFGKGSKSASATSSDLSSEMNARRKRLLAFTCDH